MFDGHNSFKLSRYWDSPYTREVEKGSTVMLLFSIRKGKLTKDIQSAPNLLSNINFAMYFNILGVIVLTDPGEQFSIELPVQAPQSFGVDQVLDYEPLPESEGEEEIGEGETIGEGQEEPML